MKALVHVTLKPDVLDPQGKAIQKASVSLGHAGVTSVRQGKMFEIELDAADEAQTEILLRLLHKLPPLIEHYLSSFIFPQTMLHQTVKLSANAQELGGTRTQRLQPRGL